MNVTAWHGQARPGEVGRGEARTLRVGGGLRECFGSAGRGMARRGRARFGEVWRGEDSFELVAVSANVKAW